MGRRELNDKKAVEQLQVKFRVSPMEKQLLNLKRKQYHYQYLSDYIRDACIYENIIQIDVSYAEGVDDLFQTYINEVRKFNKEVKRILKYDTHISEKEKDFLQQAQYRVYSATKSLIKSVNDNLNIQAIIKQSKERLYHQQVNELEEKFNAISDND